MADRVRSSVEDSRAQDLTTTLYNGSLQVLAACLSAVFIAGAVAVSRPEPWALCLVEAIAICGLFRLALFPIYRRRTASRDLSNLEAQRWALWYGIASVLLGACLAGMVGRAFGYGSNQNKLLVVALCFGLASGQAARLAVYPQIGIASGLVTLGALGIGFLSLGDWPSIVTGCLVALYYVMLVRSIRQSYASYLRQRTADREIQHLARHDLLMDLPNRRTFGVGVQAGLARAHTAKGHASVLYLDLDRFKAVNDTFGHSVGAALLIEVG